MRHCPPHTIFHDMVANSQNTQQLYPSFESECIVLDKFGFLNPKERGRMDSRDTIAPATRDPRVDPSWVHQASNL